MVESIMIWGSYAAYGARPLLIVEGETFFQVYQDILQDTVRVSEQERLGDGATQNPPFGMDQLETRP